MRLVAVLTIAVTLGCCLYPAKAFARFSSQRQRGTIHHRSGGTTKNPCTPHSRSGIIVMSSPPSFTEQVAMEHCKERGLQLPLHTGTDPKILAKMQQIASNATFVLGMIVGSVAVALVLLFRVEDRLTTTRVANTSNPNKDDANVYNISTQKGGSRTAIIALWARAQGFLIQSGGPDRLAPLLLTECLLSTVFDGDVKSTRVLQLCAWLSRLNYQLTRGIFEDQIAFLATFGYTGLVTPLQCRTCWLDDCVQAFLEEISPSDYHANDKDTSQTYANIVVLGSGYDTRCYRIPELLRFPSIRCFEVDAPGTLNEKQRVLTKVGIDTTRVEFVECDFASSNSLDMLLLGTRTRFDPKVPTLIIWEGVTMYLDEATVRQTLTSISKQTETNGGAPWYIAFDYINADWAKKWESLMSVAKEPFQFSVSLSDKNKTSHEVIENLVESCGLHLREHLSDPQDLLERYVPERVGVLGTYGGFVVASTQGQKRLRKPKQ